jgi:poly-gamma-glutamate synthase PgsB/CapB
MNVNVALDVSLGRALDERLTGFHAPLLDPIYADLRQEILAFAGDRAVASPAQFHCELVFQFCQQQSSQIAALQKAENVFQSRFTSAADDAEGRAAILEFALAMGASPRQLRRDKKAFKRFFDADAVLERYHKRAGERERALAYALERLGNIAGDALREDIEVVQGPFFTDSFHAFLGEMRIWGGDNRVRRAAHICLMHAVDGLPERTEAFWLDMALSATRRSALDETEDAWTQCAALDALLAISPQSVPSAIMRRISVRASTLDPRLGDNELFVRRHMVRMVCNQAVREPKFSPLLAQLANDPSGAVRQAFSDCLHLLPQENAAALLTRLRTDRDPQVRASIFADPARICSVITLEDYSHHILRVLAFERDEFVLRIALDAACELVRSRIEVDDRSVLHLIAPLRSAIAQLSSRELSPKVLRWAGEAREKLWLYSDEEAQELAQSLVETATKLREGQTRSIVSIRETLKCNPEKVGRVMAVLAQNDFALSIRPGFMPRIQRGEHFRPRLWRILFEGRNSATDKRQAFRHTIGRHFYGTMIAPSARMAELAPTKVPGEPLFESTEGGWRNYLPLLDQILTALDHGGETQVFTSDGITRIAPPASFFRRAWLFVRISRSFADLSDLRNREPAEFIRQLREMGVGCEFECHEDVAEEDSQNPQVTRLYGFGGVALALPVLWDRALAYFSTVYENSLVELALFIALAGLWFFGRHMALGWRARRLRNGLSLVLGGWGTRGKSGTERLKAGLVNALGPTIVSKTTGCEAMFLLGNSYGELTEMFLFRPYDKATIWEQLNLLKTSRGLNARVFLWECMGLNPSYVRVLQQDWMRDDIGTITNTYPDHEDVQGPAGRNIPEVMCEFIPQNSLLLTTEEEMLPILAQGADKAGSRMRSVNWKQAGLIHTSLLERFPYEEHPYNIALVTAMGDELGLDHDFCIKEMSDRVVADLGVLKTYPRSTINGRTLEFVMGMSANERFGALGNWSRMGFSEHSLARDPEVFVTTVVNNRADRVPRSRVFARMLVHDISADKHFLIGSNIEGLLGFIEEEWRAYADALTLFDDGFDPLQKLEEFSLHQRIAIDRTELEGRLKAMLAPQVGKIVPDAILAEARNGNLRSALSTSGAEHIDGICTQYDEMEALHQEYTKLAGEVRAGGEQGVLNSAMRNMLGRAFHAKLVSVRDFYIRGEDLVRLVAEQVPPGLVSRIMGMQNIKGTGLDWVYRWQAWEAAAKACNQLRQDDQSLVEKGLRTLASFQELGALSEAEVRASIAELREKIETIPGTSIAQVDALEARLEAQLSQFASNPETGAENEAGESWFARTGGRGLSMLEAFIDAGDAVRRRRASDRIYKAMIAEQISNQRAASELKKLTTRQKGGWLVKAVKQRSGLSQPG